VAKDTKKVEVYLTAVIAGSKDQWDFWAEAMMRIADLEHKHFRRDTSSRTTLIIGEMTYMYVDRIDRLRGRGPFYVRAIGTWQDKWPLEKLNHL